MNNKDKQKDNLIDFLKVRNSTDTTADLYFYGDIVSDWFDAWQEEDQYPLAIKDFLANEKGKDLNIYINSGGGSVFAGMAIYNMLKRHEGFKTVYVDGLAGSIASVIALAGDKVIIPSNAFFMIHKPWQFVWGGYNSIDLSKLAGDLDRIEEGIVNVYKENLNDDVDIEDVKTMMLEETWLTGKEASNYFKLDLSEEKEAVACVSNLYSKSAKTPKELMIKNRSEADSKQNKDKIQMKLNLLKLKEKR